MAADAPNWLYSLFAFSGFVLTCIPFPWHFQSWNTGTCLYMAWTALGCLNGFINSIVWNGNAINWAPVWCDISTRFMIGLSVGIPAASLCINRRLYMIASVKTVTVSKAEKRRGIMVDLAIGLGIPVLEMCLQYIVQGHRFNIFEDVGCYPMTWNTTPAYPLVFCWPVAIGVVSAIYCCLTIRALAQRRSDFQAMLSASGNIVSSRYFRLMGLAGIELLLTIPWGCYSIYQNVYANGASEAGIHRWKSWSDTHYDFSYVGQYPALIWRVDHSTIVNIELSRWAVVICAFIFFGFFGFADEARKNYRLAFTSVAKKIGYTTAGTSSSGMSSSFGGKQNMSSSDGFRATLPVFVSKETHSKRDSYASFSTNVSLGDVGGVLNDIKEPSSPSSSNGSSRNSIDEKPASLSEPQPPARPEPAHTSSTPPKYDERPDSITIV
jgi:pheromone a factor receptor